MPEPTPIEVHKALADDTRYRLYRYLRLSGRSVSVRELSTRLSLHPNTLRPHLRRLEEVGLVASETRKGPGAGRPQIVYSALDSDDHAGRDYRLLAEILCVGLGRAQTPTGQRLARASGAPTWWPGARRNRPPVEPPGPTSPCSRRRWPRPGSTRASTGASARVDITLRVCPFRDLVEANSPTSSARIHRGLLEGTLAGCLAPLSGLTAFGASNRRGPAAPRASVSGPLTQPRLVRFSVSVLKSGGPSADGRGDARTRLRVLWHTTSQVGYEGFKGMEKAADRRRIRRVAGAVGGR